MTTLLKQQIVEAANFYCQQKHLSQNELSRQTGINSGYLSVMLKGTFHTMSGEKMVEIGDRWFHTLADFIGFSVRKNYWEPVATPQFTQIIGALENAKETQKTAMLIGDTGCGKTYAIDRFCNNNPLHTYRITVSSMYKLVDIVNELVEKVGIDYGTINYTRIQQYSLKVRIEKVIDKLVDIKRSGGKPIVIFDEGENLEIAVLKMLKALYDGLKDHCAIVLIGTDQLMNKLLNLRKRNRDAIPQLYRRFKAGLKTIAPVNKNFAPFLEKYVQDKGLRKLLTDKCDNYGELNDYLEPALREADETNQPLTEQFFRLKYDMPKY